MRRVLLTAYILVSSAFAAHAGPVWYVLAFKAPAVSATSDFGTIDPATGIVSVIGVTPATLGRDIAISPAGQVYGIFGDASTSLYTIDKATGATALVGAFGLQIQSLAFRSDGALYGASSTDLYSIDPPTGVPTLIGATGMGVGADNIRFDNLDHLYGMSAESNSRLFSLNQSSGAASLIGASGTDDISLGGFLEGAFLGTNADPLGQPRVVSVNPLTGAATLGAATNNTIYLMTLDPTSVPEPGTMALAALGLLLCALRPYVRRTGSRRRFLYGGLQPARRIHPAPRRAELAGKERQRPKQQTLRLTWAATRSFPPRKTDCGRSASYRALQPGLQARRLPPMNTRSTFPPPQVRPRAPGRTPRASAFPVDSASSLPEARKTEDAAPDLNRA